MNKHNQEYNATLTDKDMEKLSELGAVIIDSLMVNLNNEGVPGYTDRMAAIKAMVSYLEIHDHVVLMRTK
jgi:hypothetical protein